MVCDDLKQFRSRSEASDSNGSLDKEKNFTVVTFSVKGLANIFVNYVLQLSFIKLITNS